MQTEYKNKLPEWWEDNQYYDLCLSNDLDSLWSCTLLQEIKGWKINYFYDFSNIYYIDKSENNAIAVDVDLVKGRCFSNHVVMLSKEDTYNPKAINLNIADRVSKSNYFNKYCGSTVLMLYSLYDVPLPKSEEGKMLLLAVDSAFLGYYSNFINDNKANYKYLVEVMQLPELYNVLKRHTKDDFNKLIYNWKLKENIYIGKDEKLHTDLKLKRLSEVLELPFFMPKNKLWQYKSYDNRKVWLPNDEFTLAKLNKQVFSMALTRRDQVKYSI